MQNITSAQARERLSKEKKNKRLEHNKNRRQSMTEENKNKRSAYIGSWYANLPNDAKNIKREYARNRYHKMIKAC